jgi:D-alanyl-D-alanine carboxypeptidase
MLDWLDAAIRYAESWLDYQMRATELPGCVIAVAANGALVRERAFGVADLKTGEALTPRHRFRVASHSKTFTAAGIFRLHEAAKLHLDDPVSRHVHGLDAATGHTTIAQLLSHSSGVLRDGVDASFWQQRRPFLDDAELRAELARPPVIDPNTRFKYSNVGFGLLGLVIEAATGERYADWISREIVAPFGLDETLPDAPIPEAVPAAVGHGGLLPLGKRYPVDGGESGRALASATGFVSTASDLAHFFNALDPDSAKSALSAASRCEMTRPQWSVPHVKDGRQYGLGVIAGSVGGRKWFGHAGAFPGFISRTATVPEWGVTVSIVTNAIDGFANPWVEGVISIFDVFSRRGAPEGPAILWAGRWWTIWGAVDLVPAGDKVLVAAPARLDPFGEAGELEVSDATSGRIALADGFASHGEPVARTIDASGAATYLKLGGAVLVPETALASEIGRVPHGNRANRPAPPSAGPDLGALPPSLTELGFDHAHD